MLPAVSKIDLLIRNFQYVILMKSYAHKIFKPKTPGTDTNISGHHGNTVKRGLTLIASLLFSMS